MSDLEITHGGVVAVDPDALRHVADALAGLAPNYADAASAVRRAHDSLHSVPMAVRIDASALWASADRTEKMNEECRTAAENTRLMADVYEYVERKAELEALRIQGAVPADGLLDRVAELAASDPRVVEMEKWLVAQWEKDRFAGLGDEGVIVELPPGIVEAPRIGTILMAIGSAAIAAKLGRLPPGTTLSGTGSPVALTTVKTTSPSGPPASTAEALRRLPETGQLKVEKYTMPDRTKKFVLYSTGTQLSGSQLQPVEGESSDVDIDEAMGYELDEPFDLVSNVELYVRREASASYIATVEALVAAGAQPGDEVHVYAHSQGAMNAMYLASQSAFDVSVTVTAGSPIHMPLGEDQLLVEFRHTDDVVSALAGGGSPSGSGSPDSVVVSREGTNDQLGFTPHLTRNYVTTAEMFDGSGDPRVQEWAEKTRVLQDAVSVESTEYLAKRD